uniref:Gag-pol polyprotein n=1 Tax=Solanum tuberosum TaxID=4113 RepID=M1DCC2_SOLTU
MGASVLNHDHVVRSIDRLTPRGKGFVPGSDCATKRPKLGFRLFQDFLVGWTWSSSNALPTKLNKDRVPNPKSQGGNCGGFSLTSCASLGRKDRDKCLADMLNDMNLDVYDFLDPTSTFSFVTLYVAMRFNVLMAVSIEPLSVSTPIGESIVV